MLYTFCKVRGEKVVIGFFNNEPQHLDLILGTLERARHADQNFAGQWQVSYILLLWLRHLLLAPFDLTTMSRSSGDVVDMQIDIPLPSNCSPVVKRILAQASCFLRSLTREQDAAAKLLVRLISRPDMQKLHLHTKIVQFACIKVGEASRDGLTESFLGLLRFLVGFTAAFEGEDRFSILSHVWQLARDLYDELFRETMVSSAICRKQVIKLVRNIAVAHLQASEAKSEDADDELIGETINFFMTAFADRDTQVRSACAKAAGRVISHLEEEMAEQVMDAIVEEYQLGSDTRMIDFSSTDSQKWHGLTLTLAYLLFQRSYQPENLDAATRALIPALNFEKRGASGNSQGMNIRDSACFAIWSMSRRYTTSELNTADLRSSGLSNSFPEGTSTIQYLATQLIVSACLDPGGNIRRGCSAALQEMVGRHPDQVHSGIALIQIIDYQAVGLRRRAMIDLVVETASLHDMYWSLLLKELQGWRGLGSPDIPSREWAAEAIGRLCSVRPGHAQDLASELISMAILGPEVRNMDLEPARRMQHGALLAMAHMAESYTQLVQATRDRASATDDWLKSDDTFAASRLIGMLQKIRDREDSFFLLSKDSSMDLQGVRADVPAAIARWITHMAHLAKLLTRDGDDPAGSLTLLQPSLSNIIDGLWLHSGKSLTMAVPTLMAAVLDLHTIEPVYSFQIDDVVIRLEEEAKRVSVHGGARAFALAAAMPYHVLLGRRWQEFIIPIASLVTVESMDWRVLGLLALRTAIARAFKANDAKPYELPREIQTIQDETFLINTEAASTPYTRSAVLEVFSPTIDAGLNDYTITEKGDVGSLARTQALHCVQALRNHGYFEFDSEEKEKLLKSVLRLSLEKLDRVRLLAAQTWQTQSPSDGQELTLNDVSSVEYFKSRLAPLSKFNRGDWFMTAVLRGFASAGTGAEHLVQASRTALSDTVYRSSQTQATRILAAVSDMLKAQLDVSDDPQATLELLAFMLDFTPLIASVGPSFAWRVLLSRVQKSHFKSSIVPKLLAAIEAYRSLARVDVVKDEVVKKLVSMIKTNPFPRVRYAAAETLWGLTGQEGMRNVDWTKSGKENAALLEGISGIAVRG